MNGRKGGARGRGPHSQGATKVVQDDPRAVARNFHVVESTPCRSQGRIARVWKKYEMISSRCSRLETARAVRGVPRVAGVIAVEAVRGQSTSPAVAPAVCV